MEYQFLDNQTRNEKGVAFTEYAFVALLIAVVAIVGVSFLGEEVEKKFEDPELLAAFE